MKVSKLIKQIREDILQLSQTEFAAALGMHRRTVQEWEYGTFAPEGGTLLFLQHLSGCANAQKQFRALARGESLQFS